MASDKTFLWIREVLKKEGPMPRQTLFRRAQAQGFNRASIYRALRVLPIQRKRVPDSRGRLTRIILTLRVELASDQMELRKEFASRITATWREWEEWGIEEPRVRAAARDIARWLKVHGVRKINLIEANVKGKREAPRVEREEPRNEPVQKRRSIFDE